MCHLDRPPAVVQRRLRWTGHVTVMDTAYREVCVVHAVTCGDATSAKCRL